MKTLAQFEIIEIFSTNTEIVLAGKLISGGPISNDHDILEKNSTISFHYNEKEISKKIIRLDRGFGRVGQEVVVEKNENMTLLIERDNETEALIGVKLTAPVIGTIVAK